MNRPGKVNTPPVPARDEQAQSELMRKAKAMTTEAKAMATEARKAGLPDISIDYYRAATGRNP